MTHDLKTPISTIETSLYIMGETDDAKHHQRHRQIVRDQTMRLTKMIDDILTVARLDHIPELTLEDTDLNQLVEQARTQLISKVEHKHLTVTHALTPDLPAIACDVTELLRAIVNLIENAIVYTPPHGVITVRTYATRGAVMLEVRDSGIGIAPEELTHVFDRFFRASNAQANSTGTGLGLAIVKRIVELHQGQIAVESVMDKGTTFRLKFPVTVRAS